MFSRWGNSDVQPIMAGQVSLSQTLTSSIPCHEAEQFVAYKGLKIRNNAILVSTQHYLQ